MTTDELGALRALRRAVKAIDQSLLQRSRARRSETRVRKPVSTPSAMATTATSTAAPSPRRIHSPAPSERFIARENPAADEQRQRERGRGARRHRRAAASSCRNSRLAAPRRSESGQGSARRRAPTTGPVATPKQERRDATSAPDRDPHPPAIARAAHRGDQRAASADRPGPETAASGRTEQADTSAAVRPILIGAAPPSRRRPRRAWRRRRR